MAKETAEQKLLKIIETTEHQEAPPASPPENVAQQVAAAVRGPAISFGMPPFLLSLLSLLKGPSAQDKSSSGFGLREINRILLLMTVVIALFLFFDFVKEMNFSQRDVNLSVKETPMNSAVVMPAMKGLNDYLQTIVQRNIFQPFEKKEIVEEKLPQELQRIMARTKDLKLVGISWLDTPQSASALIENTESGMTYFLRAGDKVNNIVIKEIYADSVLLSYEGEEMELSL